VVDSFVNNDAIVVSFEELTEENCKVKVDQGLKFYKPDLIYDALKSNLEFSLCEKYEWSLPLVKDNVKKRLKFHFINFSGNERSLLLYKSAIQVVTVSEFYFAFNLKTLFFMFSYILLLSIFRNLVVL